MQQHGQVKHGIAQPFTTIVLFHHQALHAQNLHRGHEQYKGLVQVHLITPPPSDIQ